ncbi:hypothetical protein [Paractinoplanes durhamensis]|uniref:hypothetical protein n=1 Tax=Paractinoplanes durhamensis TaxID=113563 RepID=UPI00362ABA4C
MHDADAALILAAVLRLHAGAGLLRFEPSVRVAAQLFWAFTATAEQRAVWGLRAASLARARDAFGSALPLAELATELDTAAGAPIGEYLVEELAGGTPGSSPRPGRGPSSTSSTGPAAATSTTSPG